MPYRAKAKTIVQAVTRAEAYRAYWPGLMQFGMPPTWGMLHSNSSEACWNTKINKRLRYTEVADTEDYRHMLDRVGAFGSSRAAVMAGRYERAPSW